MKINDFALCCVYLLCWYYLFKYTSQYEIYIILILLGLIIVCQKKEIAAFNNSMKRQNESYYATLNHDIKPPALAQIRILEQLLKNKFGILNKNQKEILNLSLNSCKQLYKMLKTETSTYEFIQKNKQLKYSTFDLTKLLQECIREISTELDFNNLEINFENPYSYCLIYADKIELKKVIENLLFNGILSAKRSSIIDIFLRIEDNNIILKIKTTGTYINPSEIESYFNRYCTDSTKFNKIGMGVGLYLSKQIIEAHRGKVFALSNKEKFNILGFQIPMTT